MVLEQPGHQQQTMNLPRVAAPHCTLADPLAVGGAQAHGCAQSEVLRLAQSTDSMHCSSGHQVRANVTPV